MIKEQLSKFNAYIADKTAQILSSMVFFWFLNSVILIPLIWSRPASLILWITFWISTWFQGVSLVVLAFVAKKDGDKTRELMQEELKGIKENNQKILEMLELEKIQSSNIKKIVDEVNRFAESNDYY